MTMLHSEYEPRSMTTVGDNDDAAIRALHQHLIDGWNAGSGEAFGAPFTEDASFVAFDGTRFTGRAQIAAFHQPLFETHLKGTRLVGEVRDIRFVGDDTAVVTTTGSMIARGKSVPSRERDSIQTLVACKRNGTWRLEAFQNTRLRPIGRSASGTLLWLIGDWFWKVLRPAR